VKKLSFDKLLNKPATPYTLALIVFVLIVYITIMAFRV